MSSPVRPIDWGLRDYSRCECATTPLKQASSEDRRQAGFNERWDGKEPPPKPEPNPNCPKCHGTGKDDSLNVVWGGKDKEHTWGDELYKKERGAPQGKTAKTGTHKKGIQGTGHSEGQFCICCECEHEWGEELRTDTGRHDTGRDIGGRKGNYQEDGPKAQTVSTGSFCSLCNAWRGQLGLEPTPELYVEHMVEVFKEIKRVLREDGTVFLNMGDCYASSSGAKMNDSEASYHKTRKDESQIDRDDSRGKWSLPSYFRSDRAAGTAVGTLKPKDLVGMPWRVAFALQSDGWWLRSDIIWCLSGGTKLYVRSQRGPMPMTVKDMVRLRPETLRLWTGKGWTKVLGWQETASREKAIELVLRSGERIGCTPHHEWPTQRGRIRADELRVGDIIEITRLPDHAKIGSSRLPAEDVGWFVGTYLAEGSRDSTGTIQIASHIKEKNRYHKLFDLALAYGGSARFHKTGGRAATINIDGRIPNAIIDTYISGRTAKSKHLTNAIWSRGDRFLHAVLKGYLEGDGHYDEKNDRWRLGFARNYALESDLRVLCARLGIRCRITPTTASIRGHIETHTFASFRGEIRYSVSTHHNVTDNGEVVAIRRSRARKFWHIAVEDEEGVFSLASGVLTHNSKPNPMPESVTDRPTRAHEYIFLLTKKARYFYDADAVREEWTDKRPHDIQRAIHGSPEYKRKTDLVPENVKVPNIRPVGNPGAGRNKRTVWEIATQPYPEAHFATFPQKLVEPCIKAGSPEKGSCKVCGSPWERVVETSYRPYKAAAKSGGGKATDHPRQTSGKEKLENVLYKPQDMKYGRAEKEVKTTGFRPTCDCMPQETTPVIILDPFCGSGTTGLVALKLGRRFIGVDVKQEYLAMAKKRLSSIPNVRLDSFD